MVSGFHIHELKEIVHGKLYNDFLINDERIFDFEYVAKNLPDSSHSTCFISISKNRWDTVLGKDTKWAEGNQTILQYWKNYNVIISEAPIKELKEKKIQIIVEDSYQALQLISKAARAKMKHPVIGITGSVGKSTTRLLFEHLFADEKNIVATRGNHNTQPGVMLYGAKLCRNPDVGLIEIFLNALNNRGNQSKTIQPDVCIVTSIGEAHLTTLYNTENIAKFKSRIFAGLRKNGLAIINADIPKKEFEILYREARKRTEHIRTYSALNKEADMYVEEIVHKKHTSVVTCKHNHRSIAFNLDLPSDGIVMNAMAVLLCLAEKGYNLDDYLPKMKSFQSLERIMELKQLETKDGRKIDVIDDSHNAAIPSMMNAIKTFKEKSVFYRGTKILVLGQVADLGEATAPLHESLIPFILKSGADYVFGHGMPMRPVIKELPAKMVGGWFNNAVDLSRRIPLYCSDDSLIVMKGSVTGSDFRTTSHILPSQIRSSSKALTHVSPKNISKTLSPIPGMNIYHTKKKQIMYTNGSQYVKSLEGLGAIILLLSLLRKGYPNKRNITLKKWATNKGASIKNTPFKAGQVFTIEELMEELMQTQHPSSVFELALSIYGSRNKALEQVNMIRKNCDIHEAATLNLTGRYRVKEQQMFGLDDLLKLAIHFQDVKDRLPIVSQINNRSWNGVLFGELSVNGILYDKECIILFVNMPSKQSIIQLLEEQFNAISQELV